MCAECKTSPERVEKITRAKEGCLCYEACVEKVRALEDKVAAKAVERPGRRPTVRYWFTSWLTDIAPYQPSAAGRESLRPLTLEGYWSKCREWIFPHLGELDLDAVESADLDRLYKAMYRAGRKSSYVLGVHTVIKRGLGLAVQRGKLTHNVAADMDRPGAPPGRKKKALSATQVDTVLGAIEARPDRLRWKVALAIGPRQGETLAIRWEYLDLEEGVVDTSWQIQRHTWRHGCTDPSTCGPEAGATWHVAPRTCPGGDVHARYHRQGCPKAQGRVCKRGCIGHAARCPRREGGGIVFTRPKTYRDDGDQHLVALPKTLVADLRDHRKAQAATRLKAGSAWEDHDLVFCQPSGRPLEPRKDRDAWKAILAAAGLAGAGTHAMRSTAATMLRRLGASIEEIQEVLGHRDQRTTRLYMEIDGAGLTVAAAGRMDAVFARSATAGATVRQLRPKTG